MTWRIQVAQSAQKALAKCPAKDRERILVALEQFRNDPFTGDVVRLYEGQSRWRRRVGSYRIFFNIYPDAKLVDIFAVEQRTSTTY